MATVVRTVDLNTQLLRFPGSGRSFNTPTLFHHNGTLFMLNDPPTGSLMRMYKSTDGGALWTLVTNAGPGVTGVNGKYFDLSEQVRGGHAAVQSGSKVYIFHAAGNSGMSDFISHTVFDMATESWTNAATTYTLTETPVFKGQVGGQAGNLWMFATRRSAESVLVFARTYRDMGADLFAYAVVEYNDTTDTWSSAGLKSASTTGPTHDYADGIIKPSTVDYSYITLTQEDFGTGTPARSRYALQDWFDTTPSRTSNSAFMPPGSLQQLSNIAYYSQPGTGTCIQASRMASDPREGLNGSSQAVLVQIIAAHLYITTLNGTNPTTSNPQWTANRYSMTGLTGGGPEVAAHGATRAVVTTGTVHHCFYVGASDGALYYVEHNGTSFGTPLLVRSGATHRHRYVTAEWANAAKTQIGLSVCDHDPASGALPTWRFILIDLGGGATAVTFSATVTGAGTFTATALRRRGVSATLTGQGTLSAPTLAAKNALSATLTGAGTISAATIARLPFAATLTGIGTFSAVLSRVRPASATLNGQGVLTTTLTKQHNLAATLTGAGTITATAVRRSLLAATPTGVGTLSTSLGVVAALSATATGQGTLSSSITPQVGLSATLTGAGTLSGAGLGRIRPLASTLSGAGTLSAALAVASSLAATVTGVGTLSATLRARHGFGATLVGAGTLTATVDVEGLISAALTGQGTLAPSLGRLRSFPITVGGAGTFSAAAQRRVGLDATLTGVGTLSALPTRLRLADATLTGAGTLSAAVAEVAHLSATLTGAGTLTAPLITLRTVAATLTGQGTLSAPDAFRLRSLPATLIGVGTLAGATLTRRTLAAASLAGAGTLASSVVALRPLSATVNGQGTLQGGVVARRPLAATLTGAGTLTGALVAHQSIAATLAGAGTLSVPPLVAQKPVASTLTAQGTLSSSLAVVAGLSATLTGVGTLAADLRQLQFWTNFGELPYDRDPQTGGAANWDSHIVVDPNSLIRDLGTLFIANGETKRSTLWSQSPWSNYNWWWWDSVPSHGDVQAMARGAISYVWPDSTFSPSVVVMARVVQDGARQIDTGYTLEWTVNNGGGGAVGINNLRVYRWDGGPGSKVLIGQVGVASAANRYYNFELRIDGDRIRAGVWEDINTAIDPTSPNRAYQIDITDATYSSGDKVGFGNATGLTSGYSMWVDAFSVGIDGAEWPAVSNTLLGTDKYLDEWQPVAQGVAHKTIVNGGRSGGNRFLFVNDTGNARLRFAQRTLGTTVDLPTSLDQVSMDANAHLGYFNPAEDIAVSVADEGVSFVRRVFVLDYAALGYWREVTDATDLISFSANSTWTPLAWSPSSRRVLVSLSNEPTDTAAIWEWSDVSEEFTELLRIVGDSVQSGIWIDNDHVVLNRHRGGGAGGADAAATGARWNGSSWVFEEETWFDTPQPYMGALFTEPIIVDNTLLFAGHNGAEYYAFTITAPTNLQADTDFLRTDNRLLRMWPAPAGDHFTAEIENHPLYAVFKKPTSVWFEVASSERGRSDMGPTSTLYGNDSIIVRKVNAGEGLLWVREGDTLGVLQSLAATLTGAGTLSAQVSIFKPVSGAVTGAGTLAASVSAARSLPATLTGAGTLAGSLVAQQPASASLTGTGTLSGSLVAQQALSATLAGVGTLSATLSPRLAAAATLTAAGTLSANLSTSGEITATVVGVGTLSTALGVIRSASATLSGAGTLAADVAPLRGIEGNLAGAGTLAATLGAVVPLSATVAGAGTLAGTLVAAVAADATLTAAGTLSATVAKRVGLDSTLTGVGTLSAPTLDTGPTAVDFSATLTGAGTLSATLQARRGAAATLAGAGTITATVHGLDELAATLTGVGTITASLTNVESISATLTGVGTLAATARARRGLQGALTGVGTITAAARARRGATGTLTGVGTLSAAVGARLTAAATLTGAGTLTGAVEAIVEQQLGWITGEASVLRLISGTASAKRLISGTAKILEEGD